MPMPHLLDIQTRGVPDAAGPRRRRRSPAGRVARARLPRPVPDLRREREVQARLPELLPGRAEVLRRGVHRARHDLRRAAQGHAAARRLRGSRRPAPAQEHHREGGLPGRAADHDPARHVRHQRRRARRGEPAPPLAGRGVRGGHPPERAAAVLGADHPVPGLVGRVHHRHPRRDLRPHRQEEEVPGHGAAPRVRLRDQRRHPEALLRHEGARHHRASSRAGTSGARWWARCWPADVPNPEDAARRAARARVGDELTPERSTRCGTWG